MGRITAGGQLAQERSLRCDVASECHDKALEARCFAHFAILSVEATLPRGNDEGRLRIELLQHQSPTQVVVGDC